MAIYADKAKLHNSNDLKNKRFVFAGTLLNPFEFLDFPNSETIATNPIENEYAYILFDRSIGIVAENSMANINLMVDGSGMENGLYESEIEVFFYDPVQFKLRVPVSIRIEIPSRNGVLSLTPNEFQLKQNYPNPFNPATTIPYEIPKSTHVEIKIYNVKGELVTTILDTQKNAGYHAINFDAGNLSSGVYFYKIVAGQFSQVRSMLLLK